MIAIVRDAVRSDACIENKRRSVRAFSLASSNIKGRENWSRGSRGESMVPLPSEGMIDPVGLGQKISNNGGLNLGMRIAQVAPLYESVPPKYYGGTERVVSYLTEELVRQGHEVTLFASGDSETMRGWSRRAGGRCVWINIAWTDGPPCRDA